MSIKVNDSTDIFTRKFRGTAESVDRQFIHWRNDMRFFKTFRIFSVRSYPIITFLFADEWELVVTYTFDY